MESNVKNLKGSDLAAVKALKKVAHATGVNFVVYSDEKSGSNGWYDSSKNEIHINLKGDYLIVRTAFELKHNPTIALNRSRVEKCDPKALIPF